MSGLLSNAARFKRVPRVFVSIGSNIDKENNIRSAVHALDELYHPLTVSAVYESASQGFSGENFYNLVVAFNSDETIEQLRATFTKMENDFGRRRGGERYSSRTLDIDLLLFGDLIRHEDAINLPHPDIEKYAFVLRPLAEIVPTRRHPETGLTYAQMWKSFSNQDQILQTVVLDLG